MTRHSSTTNAARVQDRLASLSPLARYLLVFGAGLIIGLVLFGWVLFPVQWTQTYPNDLQADVQNDYLLLAADSYNLSGDLERAVKRLEYWKALDLMQIANRYSDQLQAEGRGQEAERLNALVEDASIYRLSLAPQPTATPAAAPAATMDARTLRLLAYLLVGIVALAALLILMRVLHIPFFGSRTGAMAEEGDEDEIDSKVVSSTASPAATGPVAPPPPPATGPVYVPVEVVEEQADEKDEPDEGEVGGEEDEEGEDGDWTQEEEDFAPAANLPPAGVAAASRYRPAYEVLRFDGDPSYNEIRDISDRNEYAGEFGMASGKQDSDTPGAVYSMEVWLFDKSDIHTITAVLMPPDSYADENRRQQLAGNYQAIALQDSAPIQLHTKSLELEGRVKRVEFGPAGSKGLIIRHLEVELRGKRS